MFSDPAFRVAAPVDKRGRAVAAAARRRNDDVRRYYRLKGEGEGREGGRGVEGAQERGAGLPATSSPASSGDASPSGSSGSSDSEPNADADADVVAPAKTARPEPADDDARRRWARARGLEGPSASEEEVDSEASSSEESSGEAEPDDGDGADDPAALAAEWGVGALAANPAEPVPLVPDATSRLAIVDLDWDKVRAVDVLAVLRSFAPPRGRVDRVTVYPSDYGLERMAVEDVRGPGALLGRGKQQQQQKGLGGTAGSGGSASDSDDVDPAAARRRLRAYELSRLRYYYAIAECDSAATASAVYDECDGMEFLRSSNK